MIHVKPPLGSGSSQLLVVTLLVASAIFGLTIVRNLNPVVREVDINNRPIQIPEDGYVSSDACQACHPSQYDSWHGSYHRTMTQIARPDSVQARFDKLLENISGASIQLERRGDEFWAEFDDPGWEGDRDERPRIKREVVMITGSHHQQIYWYATEHERGLNVLPAVFLLDDKRWVPRSAVVLHPPGQGVAMLNGHWNAICVACHTTQPKTNFDTPFRSQAFETQRIDTTAVEFGISCEACHGPGGEHARVNQSPVKRYQQYWTGVTDSHIIQPALLEPARTSQVCGQCHSVWEFYDRDSERQANYEGFPYRPGDKLQDTRFIAQPTLDRENPIFQQFLAQDPDFVRGSFWSDGLVRVSGREYNGLIDSPCFQDADLAEHTMTCLSCHTMHKSSEDKRSVSSWANNYQLAEGMQGNDACTQCHTSMENNVGIHTRHGPDSSGSRCYNCHMPYTSYGLLKAVRSHTVTSPSVTETVETGRPNACNLCHLDKTLAWTGQAMQSWYGTRVPPLSETESDVAASLMWMLEGDAGLRALTAWSLGWKPAQETSGTKWMVPHLLELLTDPYDAVRYIAFRSLRSIDGYDTFEYDYLSSQEERIQQVLPILRTWQASSDSNQRRNPELLVDSQGNLRTDRMQELFLRRDNRGLFLRE